MDLTDFLVKYFYFEQKYVEHFRSLSRLKAIARIQNLSQMVQSSERITVLDRPFNFDVTLVTSCLGQK